jgi:hypothetical protein
MTKRIAAIAALALGAFVAVGAGVAGRQAPASARHTFRITGSVAGLYPGARRRLPLRVVNPYGRGFRVVALRVAAADAGPRCRSTNLRFGSFRGSLRFPARGTRSVTVSVRMAAAAPYTCQNARFRLRFSGRAIGG